MKKILIMAKSLGGGGSEVALTELINKLPYEKYDVTLALLDKDDEYVNRLTRKVKIVQIKFKSMLAQRAVSMYSIPAKILKKVKINSIIPYYDLLFDKVENRFEHYDIALDFYGYGYFLTGYLAKKINADKKATWLHDENISWIPNVKRYFNYYDKIFGVSKAARNALIAEDPSLTYKVDVFYNVIDTERVIRESLLPCEDKLKGKNILLSVGRLHSQKGFDIAIKAAAILKKKNIDFTWYVIGDGPEKVSLTKQIKQRGLDNQFILLGRKDNPYVYMRQCDLYVQPSRHEGYVITLVEARALCLPILSSDIPSAREQIRDGVNGYLTELNPEKMAEKIIWIMKTPGNKRQVTTFLKEHPIDFSSELKKLEDI